jgi:uncharacterized iron-regulated membrane protein
MTRHFWVLAHRYAGLYMAFFLMVAGLTGSVLAFYHELDGWLNPESHHVSVQNQPMLDGFTLREKALALEPHAQINLIGFNRKPGQVYEAFVTPVTDPATNKPYELGHNTIRLNPYNGELIEFGKDEGFWPLNRRNILPFIYSLHYSLALGEVGVWLFGIAALIWTMDCFVGFYLTLPAGRRPPLPSPLTEGEGIIHRGFWSRWAIAWKIKWPASTYRINFDLHRAGGLWTWVMLFVFAWSSVCFNLRAQVYQPMMSVLFDLPDLSNFPVANLPKPRPDSGIDWRTAQAIGQRLMSEQVQLHDFQVIGEEALMYQPAQGVFGYIVKSDRDINDENGSTVVYFDGNSGAFVSLLTPSGQNAGLTLTMWLVTLHMANIWGLTFQIFICLMGLVVAMLSITGVYIWLKKRRARCLSKERKIRLAEETHA